jgi:hypothetical protein
MPKQFNETDMSVDCGSRFDYFIRVELCFLIHEVWSKESSACAMNWTRELPNSLSYMRTQETKGRLHIQIMYRKAAQAG